MAYLLDTNIVTAIVKKNKTVNNKLEEVSFLGQEVFISCITYYEIKRGLLYANATSKLLVFDELCRKVGLLFLDDIKIIDKACEIHADLKARGRMIQDADILIAATAITHGLILVSDDSDVLRVQNISVENWLRE